MLFCPEVLVFPSRGTTPGRGIDAAGEFQNLGRDGDGLPTWTAANRAIADTDVVLWYTLGITHIPRPEDWP